MMVGVVGTGRRALVAVVAVALLAGCGGSADEPEDDAGPSSTGTADETPSDPVDVGPVVQCPGSTVEIEPDLPDAVPDGATSVRLCDGGADRVTPPVDALTTDVASVVDAVNDQPVATRSCADRQLPTYQLAFGYPDGTSFVVAGRFTGCGELLVGSDRRAKAGPPLQAFVDLLLEQRSTATPPERMSGPSSLDCAQPREEWTWPLADPAGLTLAVLCAGDPEQPGAAQRVTVQPDDLATLVDSMGADAVQAAGMLCAVHPLRYWIVGTNAWGDPITLDDGCIGLRITGETDWVPRGQARSLLKDLLDQTR